MTDAIYAKWQFMQPVAESMMQVVARTEPEVTVIDPPENAEHAGDTPEEDDAEFPVNFPDYVVPASSGKRRRKTYAFNPERCQTPPPSQYVDA